MENDKPELSGIVGVASKHAGAFVGKAAAIGQKITGVGVSGVAAVRDLLTRPVGGPVLFTDEEGEPRSETSGLEQRMEEMTGQSNASAALVVVMESDLAEASRDLEQVRSKAEKAQSLLASQLAALQEEKKSLISDLEKLRYEADEARTRGSAMRARLSALESDMVLEKAQAEAEEAKDREGTMKERVDAIESELAEARIELKKAHSGEKEKAHAEQIAEIGAKADEAAARAKAEAAEMMAKVKADAEETIARFKSEAQEKEKSYSETIAKLKAEAEEKAKAHAEQIAKIEAKAAEKNAKSQLSSDVSAVRTEPETVLSNRGQEKVAALPAEKKVISSMEASTARGDEEVDVGIEKQKYQPLSVEAELPIPADVTPEQVRGADFAGAVERIIFTRALSDIASQDTAARVDAARAMAGVRHELSVKTLVAQMAREPSAQVRQECIKALTTLEMKEGLSAVERALTDRAASVRLAAVWGLYHLAGAESAPALIYMFSDEDEEVRRRAVTCIGWLGQEALAVELLLPLSDSSVSVRRAAVEAMGNLHSRQVISGLIERLNDPEKSIRKAALGVLETITGKKMSRGPFPRNEKLLQRLIARWREWWKEEQLEAVST